MFFKTEEYVESRKCFKFLKDPENPLIADRISTILSKEDCEIRKFNGCIDDAIIHQFPLECSHDMKLCFSVTDPHHAKRVIEAINQQNGFENHLIAILRSMFQLISIGKSQQI